MVYLDLVKIRLKIMLGDFAEKNETFLTIKTELFKLKKSHFFKGLTRAFSQKMAIFLFIYN